jgi:hypothetical protein
LLDRTLVWNQRHLLHALREFEIFYNGHRPHQGIVNARPLAPLPDPITDPNRLTHLAIHRRDRLGGIFVSTNTQPNLPGRHFRQLQRSQFVIPGKLASPTPQPIGESARPSSKILPVVPTWPQRGHVD